MLHLAILLRSCKSVSDLKPAVNKGIAKVWNRNKEKELHRIRQRVPWALREGWLIGREREGGPMGLSSPGDKKPLPVDPSSSHQRERPISGTSPCWLARTVMEGIWGEGPSEGANPFQ